MIITFNNYSLQNAKVVSRRAVHTSYPGREIRIRRNASRDDFKISDSYFNAKEISVVGTIICESANELREKIDELKKNLQGLDKNLDIEYGATTRRYIATVSDLAIEEDFYNISFINYEITFLCHPFGQDILLTEYNYSNITISPYTINPIPAGSYKSLPKFTFTINSSDSLAEIRISNETTGQVLIIQELLVATDILVVDVENLTVKKNGVELDYSGEFPELAIGINDIIISTTSASHDWTLNLSYFNRYL